jgi:hypothetical protein
MSELLTYRKHPQIYVYSVPNQPGLKIGYTTRENVRQRIDEQLVNTPNPQYELLLVEAAAKDSGEFFTDKLVHQKLREKAQKHLAGEWFDTTLDIVRACLIEIKTGKKTTASRTANFPMRPEQAIAVEKTAEYFAKYNKTAEKRAPHFLWNAKMRFGKTFTSYQLAKKMDWQRILVLTYKPATEKAWREDLESHTDFAGWQFIGGRQGWSDEIEPEKPVVWFASYQDVLGKDKNKNAVKERHEKMREIDWDCLIVDEYHFGAWREAAKEISKEDNTTTDSDEPEKTVDNFAKTEQEDEEEIAKIEQANPLKVNSFLYLSGTPFRALANGEFSEDQIFNWTYADEQREKKAWTGGDATNPYLELPQIVMMTYQMPDSLRQIAQQGEFNEFDLNKFFTAKKNADGEYVFELENDVQKFLNILRGMDLDVAVENKMEHKRPALPYEDGRLLSTLTHTFWFLPRVASCHAMKRLLESDPFFSDYEIIDAAGTQAGNGAEALEPVNEVVGDGLNTRTITLSCGKLTTGVTVRAWSGVFFLRNTESPETYFQTAFRAQNPWTMVSAENPNEREIIKPTCYLLDFAPSRALKLMANYSNELGGVNDERTAEKRLEEFIEFLPVLCYDGISMTKLDATAILDISTYGTASTMLAKRWQSARLVDVTTVVLEKVLNSPDIMSALEKIEDFRNLRTDLEKVIGREKALNQSKKDRAETGEEPDAKTKKAESDEEKENRGFKRQIRAKLLKFITRVPVFMYLTDYREEKLTDVIRNLEPEMFTRVTGLEVKDFDRLCEIGVFNQTELNQAIFMFRRFEDSSLTYVGGRKLSDQDIIGGFDVVATRGEVDEVIESEVL